MSQNRVFAISSDTVRRIKTDGSDHEGCGNSKHLYVGRHGSWDYDSYLKFTLDWTDVGRIVSATLNLYNDEYDELGISGEIGIMPRPTGTDAPTVIVRRLTSAFTEGGNTDGHFDNSDYTNPSRTTTGEKKKVLAGGSNLLRTIDITAIVKAWAPSTVEGGGRATNHGIGLYGETTVSKQWSGWAHEHANASERPSITLVYELGATVPSAPSAMTPSGTVATLDQFEGDFTDVRPTDQLQSTSIEIYDAGVLADVVADGNVITDQSGVRHGLVANDRIYFTAVGGTNPITSSK